jgi:hypothetical protein
MLACAGVVDPAWNVRRAEPAPVDLRIAVASPSIPGANGQSKLTAAEGIRRRLETSLDGFVSFSSAADPVAILAIGDAPGAASIPDDLPVSTVLLDAPLSPNVRILRANNPAPVPPGWTASINATIEARGLSGRTSRIVLESQGVELASVDHAWTRDSELFEAVLSYAPPTDRTWNVTLRAVPLETEATSADNAVDLRIIADARRPNVLSYELRPSWAATFVRRAIEADPRFDVSALTEASRGLEVSVGQPITTLTADSLTPFDAVLIGAPEELPAAEVQALRSFVRRRGGTVVLLPDKRPAGRYLDLLPPVGFDELLVERPIALRPESGRPAEALQASEFAIPRDLAGGDGLASLDHGKGLRPVIVSWPLGAGRVVFSGALDSWRYRAASDVAFARFWTARIGEAAIEAPRRLELSSTPGVVRPGEEIAVRVQLRPTEFDETRSPIRLPAVRASLSGRNGVYELIRLWPTPETGVFEGRLKAPQAGQYGLSATTDTGATAYDVVTVVADAQPVAGSYENVRDAMRSVAESTGGVAVTATDLTPLERYLRSLPAKTAEQSVHPTRSLWFALTFMALTCGEWTIRRRRGLA